MSGCRLFDRFEQVHRGAYALPCISGEIKRHFRDRRWHVRVRRQEQELLMIRRRAGGEN